MLSNPFRNRRDRTSRRLTAIRGEIAALREQLVVLEEQIGFQRQVESDAQTDAVVAGHDVAAREHHAARSDLSRTQRQRDEARGKIEALLAEQDTLLEQMLD